MGCRRGPQGFVSVWEWAKEKAHEICCLRSLHKNSCAGPSFSSQFLREEPSEALTPFKVMPAACTYHPPLPGWTLHCSLLSLLCAHVMLPPHWALDVLVHTVQPLPDINKDRKLGTMTF